MLLPHDISNMDPATPAEKFTRVLRYASWHQFYLFTLTEAARRVPAGLTEAIVAAEFRQDWHDALLCYIDDCQLSIMSRTLNEGPQAAKTEQARKNLHRARGRLDWLNKNPLPKPPPETAVHWALRQLTEDYPEEFARILEVTADDPERGEIPRVSNHEPFAHWCLGSGYEFEPLDEAQRALLDAPLPHFHAAIWKEIGDFSRESMFAHPLLVQRWREVLVDMNRSARTRLGLDPGMLSPFLRPAELVIDTSLTRAQALERCAKLRTLSGIFRRQREANQAFTSISNELHAWYRANTRPAALKASQELASRYPELFAGYVKMWKPQASPESPDQPQMVRRVWPVNAGTFLNTAARHGWDVTLNHPDHNPHATPIVSGAYVLAAERPGGVPPKITLTLRRRTKHRMEARVWVKVKPGAPWMTLQDLPAALTMLSLSDEEIMFAAGVRAAILKRAAKHRKDQQDPEHPLDLTGPEGEAIV